MVDPLAKDVSPKAPLAGLHVEFWQIDRTQELPESMQRVSTVRETYF